MTADTRRERIDSQPPEVREGVRIFVRKQVVFLLILAALLFGVSGRLDWTWGWVQFVLYVLAVAGMIAAILPVHPSLLAERARLQPGTKKWDVVITMLAASLLPIATWVVAALDMRFGWQPDFSATVQIIATVFWVLGYGLTIWAMRANAYFSATVRIQSERDHRVATGGPYRIIRHPGYVGAIIFQLATPMMLGSPWGLIPSVLAALLYVVRTALEDRTLREELPGYEAYTRQTRYRLLLGVW